MNQSSQSNNYNDNNKKKKKTEAADRQNLLSEEEDTKRENAMNKIKSAIPSHCFEKSYLWSTFYLLRDLVMLFTMYYLKDFFICGEGLVGWLGYFVWVNIVGFLGWCLFVVGHDCGHGSFSDSGLFNMICGHIAHTPLLVPFNGWKISHRHHHLNHNHSEKDHGWKALKDYEIERMGSLATRIRSSPISMCLYYWYLLAVPDSPLLSGSHYNPFSRLFKPNQKVEAGISTISVICWFIFVLKRFTLFDIVSYYFVPLFVFSIWLSIVTYLHHTHPDTVIYGDSTWSYFKGSLMTVDRSYGSLVEHLHHNIGTHVLHHMFFTSIPHYHLVDATSAVKHLLGSEYFFDSTPILSSLSRSLTQCLYIKEVEKDVYQFNGFTEKDRVRGKRE